MEKLCAEYGLLRNEGGVVRVPFLIKGKLVAPPEISREQIEASFSHAEKSVTCVKLPGVQLVREPVIERKAMKYTGEYVYQVMPPVNAQGLIETDIDKLAGELYRLSVEDILEYLENILSALLKNNRLVVQVGEVCRLTSEFPDAFLDGWFASLQSVFSREVARQMIDAELSFQGKTGSDFLNGWVEVPARISTGWLQRHARGLFGRGTVEESAKSYVRAMPTRQLHITAGNAPEVPLVSALRAVLTKSAAVIKLPYGATLAGALFSAAVASAAPDHPITKNLSMVYWPGGDESIENILFMPDAFDRIVVWGSPETVASVRSRALFTRVIYLNPRYGVSLIGNEAFSGNLEETVMKASLDVMNYNQKACTSSLVHYVEGTEEQANEYAGVLCKILGEWDTGIPNFVPPSAVGQIKRMRRGRYVNARWCINTLDDDFSSGVVVVPGEFDILDHPMCRLVVVRPVANLDDTLGYLNQYVSTAGVYPEERRFRLRDRITARGVSSVFPLGQCERVYAGMPHDGMRVLSELVEWKNA